MSDDFRFPLREHPFNLRGGGGSSCQTLTFIHFGIIKKINYKAISWSTVSTDTITNL